MLSSGVCETKKISEKIRKSTSDDRNDIETLLKRLPALNNNFRLHNKIGKGTFSTVYLATLRNNNSSQKYAVKHLTQAYEESIIKNELNCLQKIGGEDNVVPAELCLTNGDDCVAFIMPYLPHLKFSDYVVEMDAEETRCYMKNLFIALRRVHSFNIIHRDVKPDNFLYDRDTKQFLLVDFGLAQLVRAPNKELSKVKTSASENIPLDYKKKRKRTSDSVEEDEQGQENLQRKSSKRIALKSKDSNVKILNRCKPLDDVRIKEEKLLMQSKIDLLPQLKQWTEKRDKEETSVKPRVFVAANVPPNTRKRLADASGVSKIVAKECSWKSLEEAESSGSIAVSGRIQKRLSFTPLVSTGAPNGKFVQVKNSRVVRQEAVTVECESRVRTVPSSLRKGCLCSGVAAVCALCTSRKPMMAPRAGTSGFRPPEVLFRYLHQTTAVDMWASGVIMLCILSGCYPFFNSTSDLLSLAEIMTIFGTDRTISVARKFGRRIVCSEESKGVDLKKLCVRLRARFSKNSKMKKNLNEPKCRDCLQAIRKDGCLCPRIENSNKNEEPSESIFPDSAFDLLHRLLDLDPSTRITAAEALNHPFIMGQ